MSLGTVLKREVRIAVSRRGQPIWFRVVKWIVIIALVVRYRGSPTFWRWMGVALVVSVAGHLVWRWKTKGWTQPWGGWSDVEAGKDP